MASHLEACLSAFAEELDRELAVIDHWNEQVALLLKETGEFHYIRSAKPIQPAAKKGFVDGGEQQLILAKLSEIKEIVDKKYGKVVSQAVFDTNALEIIKG